MQGRINFAVPPWLLRRQKDETQSPPNWTNNGSSRRIFEIRAPKELQSSFIIKVFTAGSLKPLTGKPQTFSLDNG
jgi:hypothetical protein